MTIPLLTVWLGTLLLFCDADESSHDESPAIELPDFRAIDLALADFEKLIAKVDKLHQEPASVYKYLDEMESEHMELVGRIEELLFRVNSKQIAKLESKVLEIEERESARRAARDSRLTYDQLATKKEVLLAESDAEIEKWVQETMEDEIQNLLEPLNDTVKLDDGKHCVTPAETATHIHQALTKYALDGIGLFDHARAGSIVHAMTSPTFSPPKTVTLEDVWWRRYIPDDWERLLPRGWENWNAALPSYLTHTVSKLKPLVAPPETILDPTTVPGSCWPMDGKSGHVTIRLPYPVKVDAVSIDHASSLLLADRWSAPMNIRIFGFPVCSSDACKFAGFEEKGKVLLKEVVLPLNQVSVYTFPILEERSKEGEDVAEIDAGTCTTATSCSAPPADDTFAAVQVEVVENRGHPEFTCIYRFRVHGDAMPR